MDTVLCKFDEHFGPKECRNYRRQDFLERTQHEGESVMDFVADLKHKARECGYGPIEESMICDKVIQGVRDQSLKMRLLDLDAEEQTLVNVVKLCKSSEYTQKRTSSSKTAHCYRMAREKICAIASSPILGNQGRT